MSGHDEVVILGGGPAGCAAARLLALWGHRVRLLTPSANAPALAESLPPSCGKLFDLLGVRAAIDRAGFVRSTGNTVWWGTGDAPRIERFADGGRGWQVTTGALAAILLDMAGRAGVRIDRTRVTPGDLDSLDAPIVLDCTGRAGVVARARGWRVYEPGLRTVALVGAWRREAWPIPDPTHTLIESYADGWAWSVPLSDGTRHIAVMVDPRSTDLAKAQPSREVYLSEIAKTRQSEAFTREATLEGGPWGWDASMYSSMRYADDRTLLAGDAGSFIDPLSSAGVKKALASGWLAAVAAHTALVRPTMQRTAFDFFASREEDMYSRFRDLTQRFLADAAAGQSHPFWTDRAGAFEDTPDDLAAEALRCDPAVQAAFLRIREAPALTVRRGEDVRIEPRPAVSGCEIVLEPRIVPPDRPQGVRYIQDVDLIALIDLAASFGDVGDLFEAYTRRSGPVALPDFLLTLATSVAKRWLVWPADQGDL